MAFDVFALRDRVVEEYREYFESFVNILDPRIEAFVRAKLAEGELWPDAVGLVIADRFFPSTKMCSCCGALKKMELSDRIYECDACGTTMDRDLNAALNLAKVPSASSAGYARGEDVRPIRRQTSVKREPDAELHCAV